MVVIVLSVIPIVTYILATFDGSVFALLVVALGALLISGFAGEPDTLNVRSVGRQHTLVRNPQSEQRSRVA